MTFRARRAFLFLAIAGLFASAHASNTRPWWVFFTDRGPQAAQRAARPALSPRSLERRARRGAPPPGVNDLRPYGPYVQQVAGLVERVRTVSRWLDAASVDATPEEIAAVSALACVAHVEPVRILKRPPEPTPSPAPLRKPGALEAGSEQYGDSYFQNERLGIPEAHAEGLDGTGIYICVIDAGFQDLAHPAIAHLAIAATHDFVTDSNVLTPHPHGTAVLSVLAGDDPGHLIGPAYGATFALARTEIATSESIIEVDYWIAAAEWADSLGVDVISTSLGYNTFDDSTQDYTLADLNGSTPITKAADAAVARGIVVVVSAGNERGSLTDPQWEGRITPPADGFGVIAVGATDQFDEIAPFSSIGPTADGRIKPDLVAPGVGVVVADAVSGGYTTEDGTSFSCPLVAGCAALLLEQHPDWTPADVLRALAWTAQDLGPTGPDNTYGWGIPNVVAAGSVTPDGMFGTVTTLVDNGGQQTSAPVVGARVVISGPSDAATATNASGVFSFPSINYGPYTVTVSAPGFQTSVQNVMTPQSAPIEFVLSKSSTSSPRYRLTPNPATPSTGVALAGAADPRIVVSFYDPTGALVRQLDTGSLTWNLRTAGGRTVSSGIYICRATVDGVEVWRGKLAVIR